jgi:hypothetical protein
MEYKMTVNIILALIFLGHILGDFYVQTNSMARKKNDSYLYLFLHGFLYMLSMMVVLGIGVSFSWNLLWLLLATSLSHLIIDFTKKLKLIKYKPFIIDQLLHIITIVVAWKIWGQYLQIRCFILHESAYFLSNPVVIVLLGLLCSIKPVSILIKSKDIPKNK